MNDGHARLIIALLVFVPAIFSSSLICQQPLQNSPAIDNVASQQALHSAGWVTDAVIYSAYLRSASPEGTFAGFVKRIPELKAMGVTVIWLLPIHPVGVKLRKGTLGSPYSVQDYYSVNPEFGTMDDFRNLLTTVHANGMKLIIDLVIDHTAWDSKLIEQHPEWFKHDASGAIISPNANWTDVAALDFSKPGLRKYFMDMMEWWVKEIGIDGFRCDVAEMVPLDFWNEARRRLNAVKPVMMLSEGSKPEHHLEAFDLTYSWNLYDLFDPLLKNTKPAFMLDSLLQKESLRFPKGSLRLRFNTNHDKNAWDSPAVLKYGPDGLKLTAILINTLPGVPLLYTGEEVANDQKLSLFEKVQVDWNRPHDMEKLYTTLFHLRRDHKALTIGNFVHVSSSDKKTVYAFVRISGSDKILTVVNFAKDSVATNLTIPEQMFDKGSDAALHEIFSDRSVIIQKNKPFEVQLSPRGYQMYILKNK